MYICKILIEWFGTSKTPTLKLWMKTSSDRERYFEEKNSGVSVYFFVCVFVSMCDYI